MSDDIHIDFEEEVIWVDVPGADIHLALREASTPSTDPGGGGEPGVGVPTGGDVNQALVKASSADFDTTWADIEGLGVTEAELEEALDHLHEHLDQKIYPVSVRAGGFTCDLYIPFPIEFMGGAFGTDGTLTLSNFNALGANFLLAGQTDPANNGMYDSITYVDDVLTCERRPDEIQPLRLEHNGRQISAGYVVGDSRARGFIFKIRVSLVQDPTDADVYLENTHKYFIAPDTQDNWPEVSDFEGFLLSDGLDHLAARPVFDPEEIETAVETLTDTKVTKRSLYLSDFAPEGGVLSAREGLENALNALKAQYGGELVVDGTFLIDGWGAGVQLHPETPSHAAAQHIRIVGRGFGTLILRGGAPTEVMLNIGGAKKVTFDGLTFYGRSGVGATAGSTVTDFKKGIYLWDCTKATFNECRFISLVAETVSDADTWNQGAVVHLERTDARFTNCQFQACGGTNVGQYGKTLDTPVIRSSHHHTLYLDHTDITDVVDGGYMGTNHPFRRQPSAHVLIQDPRGWSETGGMKSMFEKAAIFRSCHFDEATANAITVRNQFTTNRLRSFHIEHCAIASQSGGANTATAKPASVWLERVETARIIDSNFGHFGSNNVAIRFENCTTALVENCRGYAPATTIEADSACGTLVTRSLRGTLTTVTSAAAVTDSQPFALAGLTGGGTPYTDDDVRSVLTTALGWDSGTNLIADNRIPASIARDTEITSSITAHDADPAAHPGLGMWQLVAEATPSGIATVTFSDLLEWEEIQIRYQGRTVNTGGSQSNLLLRFNGDTGANYNGTQSGRIVATTTNSNQTAQTGIFVGYLASEQTNANRWGTGTVNFLKQPATSRKMASYETTVGQSTGENMGNVSGGIEWTNTTDAITSITLYAVTNFVAGTRFTVLGRK
jgi:hypothetical protein